MPNLDPDPDSESDLIESGSNPDPDRKHWFVVSLRYSFKLFFLAELEEWKSISAYSPTRELGWSKVQFFWKDFPIYLKV
jgi:hypothetical protein